MSKFFDCRFDTLQPYVPGEQQRGKQIIKLNTNESPYPPSPKAVEAICREAEGLNLYPDISGGALLENLAAWLGVGVENVFVGNGSDEVLAFCFQSLCPRGAAFADLTYGFYPVYASLYGLQADIVPLKDDLSLDVADYFGREKTIFIANPNAPTGLALPAAEIERLLRANGSNLVVVDEAYVDFGGESCVPLLARYDNLLVVGTFSKSRSLAGGRLGYAVGSRELMEDLNRIRFSFNPYNLNQLTLAAGAAAVADSDYFEACRAKVVATRKRSQKLLENLGFRCTDSKTNFLFVTHPGVPAEALQMALKEQDILVRWFNVPRIDNYLRITVGTDEQMDILVECLAGILQKNVC